jgi:hypothetical protein
MLKIILIVVAVLIAGLLAYAATRPDSFRIQRAATVNASPEKISPLISDFHNWGAWSPWEKIDPSMQRTFSGAPAGKGAVYEWSGNGKAGAGRMEILEASPAKVSIKLDFIKPFEGHNVTDFTLDPNPGSPAGAPVATRVNWDMHGPSPYLSKLMGVFMNLDRMVGKDFEQGLANLKTVAEK